MKPITIDSFNITDKPYDTAVGNWDATTRKFNINYSTILTKLIQEAGRWCEHYASDLFIDWITIDKELSNHDFNGGRYVFGFRESGVDSFNFITLKLNDHNYNTDYYRAFWTLDIVVKDETITMKLGRVRL